MTLRKATLMAVVVLVSLLPADVAAQGTASLTGYSAPTGLTEAEDLRIIVVLLPVRQPQLCEAELTVDILDAINLTLLRRIGPQPVGVGHGFQADYTPSVGPAPARQEVIVRAMLERRSPEDVRRRLLPAGCPMTASLQTHDRQTGSTKSLVDNLDIFIIPTTHP